MSCVRLLKVMVAGNPYLCPDLEFGIPAIIPTPGTALDARTALPLFGCVPDACRNVVACGAFTP